MDWEEIWMWILVCCVIVASALLVTVLLAPHNVDYYYVSQPASSGTATCVYAHWTWHGDERAFCTNDVSAAIDFAQKATLALKH